MSLAALGRVMYADVSPSVFRVLVNLADGADEHHITMPSIDRLSTMTRLSVFEVQAIVDGLIEKNYLEPVHDLPHDLLDDTEGFRLLLDRIPTVEPESVEIVPGGILPTPGSARSAALIHRGNLIDLDSGSTATPTGRLT